MVSEPRFGLFGLLGSGNLGNDGSLDAVVAFLRDRYPDANLGFMCMGPGQVIARYGVPATPLQWYEGHAGTVTGARAVPLKVIGKVLDSFRTLAWTRRHDVVIVPGMGVLEATLPLRPWGFPYSLLCLCVSARLVGTKVALVSVGADVVGKRVTRWMITWAARLVHYRSYRDDLSRDAMRDMGIDVVNDPVYQDLAFALPSPPAAPADRGTVGVGVMAYYGGNDDRWHARAIHGAYLATMKYFVRWLVDGGRQVRLFTGDEEDEHAVTEIVSDLRVHRPGVEPSRVVAEPVSSLTELMGQMTAVDTVVATRYHNVLCALKVEKPTLSIGYAAKNDVLMAGMGLGEFCQSAQSIDVMRLIEQFTELESRREGLVGTIAERKHANVQRVEQQFAALSTAVLDSADSPAQSRHSRCLFVGRSDEGYSGSGYIRFLPV